MLAIAIVALLPWAAVPSATIQDGARIATFDDVYRRQPPTPKAKPPAPRHVARRAPAAIPAAPPPEPEMPQVIRHVPPPVVTLESNTAPAQRATPAPVVTLPTAGD